ncbi:hypothetical protein Pelo_19846 [Pelomyxa schiedti]|nr:hypothetical protein Pelo_19846 [Pelomyxa schiedti]
MTSTQPWSIPESQTGGKLEDILLRIGRGSDFPERYRPSAISVINLLLQLDELAVGGALEAMNEPVLGGMYDAADVGTYDDDAVVVVDADVVVVFDSSCSSSTSSLASCRGGSSQRDSPVLVL